MPLKYKHLSQEDQDDALAQAILSREKEHHNYELNRINYEAMLEEMEDLPDWPANLVKYRAFAGEALAAALDGPDYDLACKLQFRDRVKLLLATTIAEQAKVEAVYVALEKQLPDGNRRTAAIKRVQDRESAHVN